MNLNAERVLGGQAQSVAEGGHQSLVVPIHTTLDRLSAAED
jgi:hypothetical protein